MNVSDVSEKKRGWCANVRDVAEERRGAEAIAPTRRLRRQN